VPILVGVTVLFNIVVGLYHFGRVGRAAVILLGIALAVAAGWESFRQGTNLEKMTGSLDQTSQIIRRIAAAMGIPPDQSVEVLGQKALEKQLGTEGQQLSNEIFAFLADNKAFDYILPPRDSWDDDIKAEMSRDAALMLQYDEKLSAGVLSSAYRVEKSKTAEIGQREQMTF
jgi:hypothetical protein